jgi:hypothetical protein
MNAKGNKILKNVKTRWINMISPTKWVTSMYMSWLAKMVEDNSSLLIAKVNFELLVQGEFIDFS